MIELIKKYKPSKKSIISFTDSQHPNIKYVAHNKRKYSICDFKIDNDLIKDDTINKCDFGLYVVDSNNLFLLELKGTEIEHAYKQIVSTCLWFRSNVASFCSFHLYIRIISKSYDIKRQFHISEYKKVLKSKYNVNEKSIIIKNKILEENIF